MGRGEKAERALLPLYVERVRPDLPAAPPSPAPPSTHSAPRPGSSRSWGAATSWEGKWTTSQRMTVIADASGVLLLGPGLPCVPLLDFPSQVFETALSVGSCL